MKNTLILCFLGGVCLPMTYAEGYESQIPVGIPMSSQSLALPGEAGPRGLIYGELVNSEAIAPMVLRISPYKFSRLLTARQLEYKFSATGRLDARPEKFRIPVPQDEAVYFSLLFKDKVILEDYLLFPHDCVKISVDMQSSTLGFGGPQADWLEVQYAIREAGEIKQISAEFPTRSINLDQGMDREEKLLFQLIETPFHAILGWKEVEEYQSSLPQDRVDLLKTELIGHYFGSRLRSFRLNQYSLRNRKGHQQHLEQIQNLLTDLSAKLKADWQQLTPSLISSGYSSFLTEWVKLERMITDKTFETIATDYFEGEVLDRLLTGHLLDRIRYSSGKLDYWEGYAKLIGSVPWKELTENSLIKYRRGVAVKNSSTTI